MSSTATLERPDAPRPKGTTAANATAATSPTAANSTEAAAGCPKCGNLDSWGTASWCPKCGYYPRFGTTVALEGAAAATQDGLPAPSSHLEALARLPKWAYVLAGGIVAIFVISVAVRVVIPDDSLVRSLWSITQLVVGGGTFIAMHVYAFLRAGMKTDRLNFFDMIVHPIEVWRPSFQELPATSRRIWAGAWGFMASACAILIIGGIRYSALTDDWGFKERPKQNLMKKIKDQLLANAKDAEEGADNLEDAINDFAGDDEAKNKGKHELEMLSADCVVVGFNIDKNTGEIRDLVLASVIDERLQYAGMVTGGIPPELQKQLRDKLPALAQEEPFLKCPVAATWVKPVVTCRTSFKSWSDNKRMQQPVLKELLADTDAR
jgi:hypothetical protein